MVTRCIEYKTRWGWEAADSSRPSRTVGTKLTVCNCNSHRSFTRKVSTHHTRPHLCLFLSAPSLPKCCSCSSVLHKFLAHLSHRQLRFSLSISLLSALFFCWFDFADYWCRLARWFRMYASFYLFLFVSSSISVFCSVIQFRVRVLVRVSNCEKFLS